MSQPNTVINMRKSKKDSQIAIKERFSINRYWSRYTQQPLGKWCLEKGITLPGFWFSAGWTPDSYRYCGWQSDSSGKVSLQNTQETDGSQPEPTLRSLEIDKLVCQALARTLWDISPQMTIADMCKHEAVQHYGNGRLYKTEYTLRAWLSEVAPPEVKGKRGRPKKSET